MRTRSFVPVGLLLGLAWGVHPSDAVAQGRPSAPPSTPPPSPTWHWPLYESVAASSASSTAGYKTHPSNPARLVTGPPRPNVWGSHMAFEEYGSGPDLHPGIDIRGKGGDIVEVPLAGKVVYIQNHAECRDGTGDKCRIFIRSGSMLYYLGHFSFGQAPNGTMIRTNRDMVQSTVYSGEPESGWDVEVGDQIGQLESYRSPANWDHLHISLFDVPYLYDNLDPLRYLSGQLGDPNDVARALRGFAIAGICSTYLVGVLLDRIPARFGVVLSALLLSGGLLMPFVNSGASDVLLYDAALGSAAGAASATNGVLWVDYFGLESLGAINGTVSTVRNASTALAAPLAAWLIDSEGGYSALLVPAAVLSVTASCAALLLPKPPREFPTLNDQELAGFS